MKIEYAPHAEEKIADREIPKKIIESAIIDPLAIIDSIFNRKIAHKLIKDKLLRVVFEIKGNTYIVITAYYTYPKRYLK